MMTIQEMRNRKQKEGYTYARISALSGVPVSTIQKIFRGETVSPRYDTVQALERAFISGHHQDELRESTSYGASAQKNYGIRVVYWSTTLYFQSRKMPDERPGLCTHL